MKQDSSSEKNGNKSKNQQLSELMSPTTDLDGLIGGMITVHGGQHNTVPNLFLSKTEKRV